MAGAWAGKPMPNIHCMWALDEKYWGQCYASSQWVGTLYLFLCLYFLSFSLVFFCLSPLVCLALSRSRNWPFSSQSWWGNTSFLNYISFSPYLHVSFSPLLYVCMSLSFCVSICNLLSQSFYPPLYLSLSLSCSTGNLANPNHLTSVSAIWCKLTSAGLSSFLGISFWIIDTRYMIVRFIDLQV